MSSWIKHSITCRCILNQLKSTRDPPRHRFVVFSIIDENDNVEEKLAQCNNCGVIHCVTDVGRSKILKDREQMSSLVSIDDIRMSIPDKLSQLLDTYRCDLPTWEAVKFIIDNERWGDFVVLVVDVDAGARYGKYLRILGTNLFKVEAFSREEALQ